MFGFVGQAIPLRGTRPTPSISSQRASNFVCPAPVRARVPAPRARVMARTAAPSTLEVGVREAADQTVRHDPVHANYGSSGLARLGDVLREGRDWWPECVNSVPA